MHVPNSKLSNVRKKKMRGHCNLLCKYTKEKFSQSCFCSKLLISSITITHLHLLKRSICLDGFVFNTVFLE